MNIAISSEGKSVELIAFRHALWINKCPPPRLDRDDRGTKSWLVAASRRRLRKDKSWRDAMRLATTEEVIHGQGLRAALARGIRPAVGFTSPDDVVKDPHLGTLQKRAILASWASDASAVQDEPTLRWLLGTPEPVPYAEVRDAILRLDRRETS